MLWFMEGLSWIYFQKTSSGNMLREILDIMDILDSPNVSGEVIKELFSRYDVEVDTTTVDGEEGSTDFVKIFIKGTNGKTNEGESPSIGIIGELGGIGARPEIKGMVSDADGAIVALASALKLAKMRTNGDELSGDIIVTTHICPDSPIVPHEPVPFMDSHVDIETSNKYQVDEKMDAILSIDATKGNRVHCEKGFAITPTIKEGWVLRVSEDLLDIQERVTGETPSTLTVSMQDITPYGNDIFHINSILQSSTATNAAVVGIATTSVNPVPGCATGANYEEELAQAATFVVETAKEYTEGDISFYDKDEFDRLINLYGSMKHLQEK